MTTYSATAEDVFALYERNKSVYDDCKLAGRECPDIQNSLDCYCSCLLYTSPSPRDRQKSRMPSSA